MTQSALQSQFVESVVSLNPKTATFDCDGTLWSVDAGEGFFSWELEEKLVPDEIARWWTDAAGDFALSLWAPAGGGSGPPASP